MMRGVARALAVLALPGAIPIFAWACGPRPPALLPTASAPPQVDAGAPAPPLTETSATDSTPKPVPTSMVTYGVRAAEFAQKPPPPDVPPCTKEERLPLTFEHAPTYTEKLDKGGTFSARLFVGNPAPCSQKVAIPLSFTPPKTTATRTVDFAANVPPRGALIELRLTPSELEEIDVRPGRYAITFAVQDEEEKTVGKALSGNPFRLGRDDVVFASPPKVPKKIAVAADLVVPVSLQNSGDTANRITPLIVFTRPGDTNGIEHYDPPQLVVPGSSSYTIRLSAQEREAEGIKPGSWLVTVTMFDAAGDRLGSYAGLPLAIGEVDLRMTRPVLPTRVKSSSPLRATFKLENRGDTSDKVTAIVAFTKPGTSASVEFAYTREIPVGTTVFDAIVAPAQRREKSVNSGVWLISTAAFKSSGERIKGFTGHYLEIVE